MPSKARSNAPPAARAATTVAPTAAPSSATATPPARPARRRSPRSQAEFKEALLAHARQVYLEKGLDGLSIRALTRAFAMSPMAFYGYFASKHDLARHICVDFFRELLDRQLLAAQGKRSPVQVLGAHVRAYFAYWEAYPDRYRLVYMPQGAEATLPTQLGDDPVYRALWQLMRERVVACAHGRDVPERAVRLQCDLVLAKAVGYLHATLVVERYPFVDRDALRRLAVQDIVDGVVAALGPRP